MRVFPDERGPMASWSRVEAMPGIADALDGLRPFARIALATNAADSTETMIWDALGRVGLERLFDRVYCYRKIVFMSGCNHRVQLVFADKWFCNGIRIVRIGRFHQCCIGR